MAVKPATPKSDKAEKAPVVETVDLQLNRYTRYYYKGDVYEKGVRYTVSREQALDLLSHDEDGVPIFGRFRAQPKPEEVSRPKEVDMSQRKPKKAVAAPVKEDAAEQPKAIEIGSEEEFEALLAAKAGEGDGEEEEREQI